MTTVRPEKENAACSDTGLVTFYAGETASLDYGPEPLRYDVPLELDGRRYRAEATAPADIEQRNGTPR